MSTTELLSCIEKTLVESHVLDVRLLFAQPPEKRLASLTRSLDRLGEGAYLVGTGPYTVGVYRLSTDECVIGRFPTPGESESHGVPDVEVRDYVCLAPRETSRRHARICRCGQGPAVRFYIEDLDSTCGTYVNKRKVETRAGLNDGDVVWVGPSGINSFVFFTKE